MESADLRVVLGFSIYESDLKKKQTGKFRQRMELSENSFAKKTVFAYLVRY